LKKEVVLLEEKIGNLRDKQRKSQMNISILEADIEILKSKFWELKGRK